MRASVYDYPAKPIDDGHGNLTVVRPLDIVQEVERYLWETRMRELYERTGLRPVIAGGAASAWTFYNNFHLWISDSTFNLTSGTQAFNMALFLSTSNFATVSNSLYGDLTFEHANANGYTTGGVLLGSQTWTVATATAKFTSAAPTWTAAGGSIVARAAVIYLNATSNTHIKPLLCYCLLDATPADVTVTTGNTLTVTPNASGIFTLTG